MHKRVSKPKRDGICFTERHGFPQPYAIASRLWRLAVRKAEVESSSKTGPSFRRFENFDFCQPATGGCDVVF